MLDDQSDTQIYDKPQKYPLKSRNGMTEENETKIINGAAGELKLPPLASEDSSR